MTADSIAQVTAALSGLVIAFQARRILPLCHLFIRLVLDVRRRQRRFEAAAANQQPGETDGTAFARTPTPEPDQLEHDAAAALADIDRRR